MKSNCDTLNPASLQQLCQIYIVEVWLRPVCPINEDIISNARYSRESL